MQAFYKSLLFFALLPTMQLVALQGAESADLVIQAKYVLTMDSERHLYSPGAVAIRGTKIAAVGSPSEITRRFQAKSVLDKPDGVLAPGLIDTHTHAPMSLFRAIADDKRLEDWLTNFIFPAEAKNVTADFVRWGTRLACLEMVLAGITTYTDMYFFEDVEAETAKEAGVRGVLGQTIMGFPSPDHKNWREALASTEQYIQRFQGDELIVPAVAPHAIYTTPNEALVAAHKLAAKYQVPFVIHLAETEKEYKDAVSQRGQTPTQVLDHLGVLEGRVIAAHCVWESDADLQVLKQHGTGVAHCPSSNMKLASGVARIQQMLRLGVTVGLGTDGFAGSNDSADLIREMDLAAKLQKVITRDPTALNAEQALEMATMGGARVLGLEKRIGSLEPGKQADLIAINLARPNATPVYNIYSQLAYASKASDVEDVFINGRQIVSNRRALTLDSSQILAQAEKYRQKIASTLPR